MKYNFEDYNEDNVLKAPLLLSLSCLYLSKYLFFLILIPIISAMPRLGTSLENILPLPQVQLFVDQPLHILFLCSSLPAFAVLIALVRRSRYTKGTLFRQIWRHGATLLWVSIGVEAALIAGLLVMGVDHINEWWISFLYLDLMLALYLFKSRRLKDVFAEFPAYQRASS